MPRRPATARSALPLCILALLIAVAAAPPGSVAQGEGDDGPEVALMITSDGAGVEKPFEAFDMDRLSLVDVNGDGLPEIVAHNDNNRVYVLDPRTGRALAELTTRLPEKWDYREISPVGVGDLDGNGRTDLVVGNTMGVVTRFEFDPMNTTEDRFVFEKAWELQVSPTMFEPDFYEKNSHLAKTGPAFDGGPYLADADGDGFQEIFLISDNVHGIYTLNHDGTIRWGSTRDDANTNPTVTDLEGDGRLDVVYVTDAGQVFVLDAATGHDKWSWSAMGHGVWPASISISPAIVDVDACPPTAGGAYEQSSCGGDGRKEIHVGARQAEKREEDGEHWYMTQHAQHFLLNHDGSVRWHTSFPQGAPMYSNRAAVGDFSGDGRLDLAFMDWNTVGHKPGQWQNTGPPHLYVMDAATGNLHRGIRLDGTYYGNKDILAADADGDGTQEFVVNRARDAHRDGLAWLDFQGNEKGWIGIPDEWRVINDPVAGSVTGDGTLQVVVPLAKTNPEPNYRNLGVGHRHGAIAIVDFGVPHDVQWSAGFLFNHDWDRPYDKATGQWQPPQRPWMRFTPATDGSFSFEKEGPVNATRVIAQINGTGDWFPLAGNNGTWTGNASPTEGMSVRLLAYGPDDRFLATAAFTWSAEPPSSEGGPGSGWLTGPGGGNPVPGAAVPLVAMALLGGVFLQRRRGRPGG